MTPECKRIKICCLTSLAIGLAEIVVGFLVPTPFGTSFFAVFTPITAGILSLVIGVHGSRAANVPAKAAALVPFALVICVLTAACLGAAFYLGHGFTYIAAIVCVPLAFDVLVAVFARQARKALERA